MPKAKKEEQKKQTVQPSTRKAAAKPEPKRQDQYGNPLRVTEDFRKIHIIAPKNPRREGTGRHARFAAYKEGMTVADWLKTDTGTRQQMLWDVKEGHISLK